jgi:hypothetical protein
MQWFQWVAAVVALSSFTALAFTQHRGVRKATKIQGHIVRVQGPDQFVVRTTDKREVILHTNSQTRFLLNNRAVRFADLREGAEIAAEFEPMGERKFVGLVTITPAGAVEEVPAAELVEGTVIRVLEADNQLVVRTARGQEMVLFAGPRTTFTLDERAARLADFRPGTPVRVNFHVIDNKNMMRSVVAMPKLPR